MSDELIARLGEYRKDAKTLLDHIEEAIRHAEGGDLKSAAEVVSISNYPLSHLSEEWRGLMEYFGSIGVEPGE